MKLTSEEWVKRTERSQKVIRSRLTKLEQGLIVKNIKIDKDEQVPIGNKKVHLIPKGLNTKHDSTTENTRYVLKLN